MHFPEGWAKEKSKKVLNIKNSFYHHAGLEEGGGPCVGGGSKGASYNENRRLCHTEEGSNGKKKCYLTPYNYKHFNWPRLAKIQ